MAAIRPAGRFIIIVVAVGALAYGVSEYLDHKAKTKPAVAEEVQAPASVSPASTPPPVTSMPDPVERITASPNDAGLNKLLQAGKK